MDSSPAQWLNSTAIPDVLHYTIKMIKATVTSDLATVALILWHKKRSNGLGVAKPEFYLEFFTNHLRDSRHVI